MKNLERVCKLQREFKALYEDDDMGLIGIGPNSVQVMEGYFFKVFKDFNVRDRGDDYMEANAVHEGIKFIALVSKKDI